MPRPLFDGPVERVARHAQSTFPGTLRGRNRLASPIDRSDSRGIPSVSAVRGSEIHRVAALADLGQTVAAAGAAVQWATELDAPIERVGFGTFHTQLQSGTVGAVPSDVTGVRLISAALKFDAEYTGTVTVKRVRQGVETVLAEEQGTGDQWNGTIPNIDIRSGDTTAIEVDADADVTVAWGWVFVRDDGVGDPAPKPSTRFALAQNSEAIAWDGEAWWLVWDDADTVYRVSADGSTILDSWPSGLAPKGVAWDGTHVWVSSHTHGEIMRYEPDGTLVDTIAVTANVSRLTWDGTALWCGDTRSDPPTPSATLRRYATDGTLLTSFAIPGATDLLGVAYEPSTGYLLALERAGDLLWVVETDGTVVESVNVSGVSQAFVQDLEVHSGSRWMLDGVPTSAGIQELP